MTAWSCRLPSAPRPAADALAGLRRHRGPPGRRLPGGPAPPVRRLPPSPVARADPTSDGAAIRTLDLLLPDVAADWREGEVLLQGLLHEPSELEAASGAVARIEGMLLDIAE